MILNRDAETEPDPISCHKIAGSVDTLRRSNFRTRSIETGIWIEHHGCHPPFSIEYYLREHIETTPHFLAEESPIFR